MNWLAWVVRRRVAISMLYAAVALLALTAGTDIPVDLFPEIEPPVLSVVTLWPGASAEDVEDLVTDLLEDELNTVANLDQMDSSSRDNLSIITLVFDFDHDLDAAANEVRDALGNVAPELPDDAEAPRLLRMKTSGFPVYIFAARSRTGDAQPYADYIRDDLGESLRRVPGVGSVTVYGAPENLVRIEADPAALEDRGLTLVGVAERLRAANVSVPAGFLDLGEAEYSVRVPARFTSIQDVEDLVLASGPRGEVVRLGDVASVVLAPADSRELSSVDGRPAVLVAVQKASGANTVDVVAGLRERLDAARLEVPADLELIELIDGGQLILAMIDSLQSAVTVGGVCVALTLLLFVRRFRPALIIATTIPVSMLVVLLAMAFGGYTINVVTLISTALCVGMVVDNAIVVLESIITHIEGGASPQAAAVTGTREVAGAVLASTLTSIVIFAPLALISNLVGIFFGQLAFIAVTALVASMVTSFLLTPMLAAWLLSESAGEEGPLASLASKTLAAVETRYGVAVRAAVASPWRVIALALALTGVTVILGRTASSDLVQKMDSGDVDVFLTLRPGTRVEESMRVGERLATRLRDEPDIVSVRVHAGESMSGTTLGGGQEGTHIALVSARMLPPERRERADVALAASIRVWLVDWPEVTGSSIRTGNPMMRSLQGGQSAIYLRVGARSSDDLERALNQVREALRGVRGVENPWSGALARKPELRLQLGRTLTSEHGTREDLAALTARLALAGSEIGRVDIGATDYPLHLSARDDAADTPEALLGLAVPSVLGGSVPLHGIARMADSEGPIEVLRRNRRRFASVEADLGDRPLGDVLIDIEAALLALDLPEGVTYSFGGDVERQAETAADLKAVLGLSFALLVMVLASQFESFTDAAVILLAVPFAFTGTFLCLMLTGMSITLFAFLGLIILMGIVVNNSIVLVDYVHTLREQGERGDAAVVKAAQRRMRPVLMTTVTTAAGMFPLAVSRGLGHELWQPIGVTVIGGLLVSTGVTLVLVPTVYAALERWRMRSGARLDAAG